MSSSRSVSVIGLGRVGLPLALSFAYHGVHVLGVDHDGAVLASVRAGRMPFAETGTQELLERVLPTGRLELAERAADAARADDIVITIGTPSFSHVESDLRQVRVDPSELTPRRVEEIVREQTGRAVSLRPGEYRAMPLPTLDDFTPDAVVFTPKGGTSPATPRWHSSRVLPVITGSLPQIGTCLPRPGFPRFREAQAPGSA